MTTPPAAPSAQYGWNVYWLIEKRGLPQAMWLKADGEWTLKADEALWFIRRDDAEKHRIAAGHDFVRIVVCDHAFAAAPSAEALPPADGADTCAASRQETIETLREIAAYFRKEYAYEMEHVGAGGSRIAAGRWERFYRAAEYLADELVELPRILRERAAPNDALRAAMRDGAECMKTSAELYEHCWGPSGVNGTNKAAEWRKHAALLERAAEGGK